MDSNLDFLGSGALQAAPLLLGWEISRKFPEGDIRLKIVETEAYMQSDPASHSFKGQTLRTAPMFMGYGHWYVYFTYGMHYCINIVSGQEGHGEGILLRAAEPLEGIEIIRRYRLGAKNSIKLSNGPGKLAQALGIRSTEFSGTSAGPASLELYPPKFPVPMDAITRSPRVGISRAKEKHWRFYIKNNQYVSK